MLDAIVATGGSRWDAMVTAIRGGFPKDMIPLIRNIPDKLIATYGKDVKDAMTNFARHAARDSDGANAALAAFMTDRSVDKLAIRRRAWIRGLPAGLSIDGNLNLYCCKTFRSLSERIRVRGDLWLLECPAWDGRIPPDAQVSCKVFTDWHPAGITLMEWRSAHPDGEAPAVGMACVLTPWDEALAGIKVGAP